MKEDCELNEILVNMSKEDVWNEFIPEFDPEALMIHWSAPV